MTNVVIDSEKCIGCGSCVRDCVAGYLTLADGKAVTREAGCIGCGHCYAVCPVEAITIPGMEDGGELAELSELDSTRLLQAMKSRRSIRQFQPKPVEPEKVGMILDAGRYCPTGSNAQDVCFTILGSRQNEIEKACVELFRKGAGFAGRLSAMAKNIQIDDHFFFKGAPLVIVVSSHSSLNGGLASSYMELMAESLGLGVLYSGFFTACCAMSPRVKAALDLPKGQKVISCMVIGYPNVKYRRVPGRKSAQVRTL